MSTLGAGLQRMMGGLYHVGVVTREIRILFIGNSNIYYTETTAAASFFEMALAELRRRAPDIDWVGFKEALFFAPNVGERAAAARERYRPDAVLFCPPIYTFLHDYVANNFAAKPRLQRLTLRAAALLRRLAGGGYEGAASARGLIFRLPRAMVRRFVPGKALVARDDAIEYSKAFLRAMSGGNAPAIVVRLAIGVAPTINSTRRYRAVLDRYNEALIEYCDGRGIRHYDLEERLTAAGQRIEALPDFIHIGPASRRVEASVAAELLIEALRLESAPGAGSGGRQA